MYFAILEKKNNKRFHTHSSPLRFLFCCFVFFFNILCKKKQSSLFKIIVKVQNAGICTPQLTLYHMIHRTKQTTPPPHTIIPLIFNTVSYDWTRQWELNDSLNTYLLLNYPSKIIKHNINISYHLCILYNEESTF